MNTVLLLLSSFNTLQAIKDFSLFKENNRTIKERLCLFIELLNEGRAK